MGPIVLYRRLSEFRQIYLRIQAFVGLVILESNALVSDSPKLSYDPAHVKMRNLLG
ncbi:hypothetical protein LEP1GSC036_0076 [Leptospira weilii str. 2006001853]|uniref:Uncharacterized protein n=1 Tax=Leptospira weilii str. 2006001853 TaxID=1001589 RepID=A0A828YW26_9LEPT|nr:hypothetical protein LEP1GSC036_0076 [Leptospira weilii str. 2006001853]